MSAGNGTAGDPSAAGAGGETMGGTTGSGGEESGTETQCQPMDPNRTPPYTPVYRIPLRVHRTRSTLSDEDLCGVLEEINEIWWKQAAICFEIHTVNDDETLSEGMDLWFEETTPFPNGIDANGVYSSPHEIYSLDQPSLASAPNPVTYFAGRTGAHELGHGLSLQHQNCGSECDDLLMTSGRQGYEIATGSPADTNEQANARERAASGFALDDTGPTVCGPPVVGR